MDSSTTLLIVDGHAGVREALARRLRRVPTIGAIAATGDLDHAARVAREIEPDAVLYDPHTVQGDTFTALARLRVSGQPVVVLTALLVDGEEETWLGAGAAAVLLKGCAITALLDSVDAALGA